MKRDKFTKNVRYIKHACGYWPSLQASVARVTRKPELCFWVFVCAGRNPPMMYDLMRVES